MQSVLTGILSKQKVELTLIVVLDHDPHYPLTRPRDKLEKALQEAEKLRETVSNMTEEAEKLRETVSNTTNAMAVAKDEATNRIGDLKATVALAQQRFAELEKQVSWTVVNLRYISRLALVRTSTRLLQRYEDPRSDFRITIRVHVQSN